MFKIRQIKGFTLAEILVTLGVIGVIASMTVPTLIQDIQDAQFKSAWKKSFADFSQATKRILFDNAGSMKGVCPDNQSICMRDKYITYLSYTKTCSSASTEKCWHTSWKSLDGTERGTYTQPGIILNNGTMVLVGFDSQNCTSDGGGLYRCGWMYIDINGFKGPNIISKDIFPVHITEKGIYPYGSLNDTNTSKCENSTGIYAGTGCATKYLYQ